ncbi:hypothetical protein [Nannocystis pusilla]|uniref:hypothetical protein n=1 Tax=Nannocystis pusilla TaxID=889268 RepID=UPI003B76C0EB
MPQDLLSKERNLLRQLIVPRVLEDPAYKNARENSDPQNARIEHDKALGRVMLAIFDEDPETHGELYRRYADDESFRHSLHEQSFAATYEQRKPASGRPQPAAERSQDQPVAEPPASSEQASSPAPNPSSQRRATRERGA